MKCLGAIVGDILGQPYEFGKKERNLHIKNCDLFSKDTHYTDDTVLTIAFMSWLLTENYSQENLLKYVLYFCQKYHFVGYGHAFREWLSGNNGYKPYGSWGNGSAMRTSPIAWWFNDIGDVMNYSELGASITHNNEDAIKGAQAISVAIYLARHGASKEQIKNHIETVFKYDLNRKLDNIAKIYRFDSSCKGSVPEAIICFLEADSVESAIQNAIYLVGDTDTQADMAAAIAEAYYKNDETEKLFEKSILGSTFPIEFLEIINNFNKKLNERE